MATDWPIVFNLVNSIIGVSVLAMPFCFHECGIILGPLLMITSGFLTKCSCELLLKGAQMARKRSYELLALHTYGTAGKLAVQASIIGLLIGTLIAFNVIVGDLAPSIFQGLSGVQVTGTVRAVVMLVMSLGVALPLCMMRNIQSLAAFSSLALFFYFGFVCQMFFTSFPKLLSLTWTHHVYYWRPSGILSCLPIFSLAFACQTQLFVLYDSLPEPSVKRMQNVVNTAMNIVSLIYLLVGVLGYICFYDVGVKGDVLTNYGNGFVVEVIKCGFMFSVLVSFPLMMFPIRDSINNLITLKTGAGMQDNVPGTTTFIPHNRFVYITVSVLLLTLTVGILLPHIEFVLALTGATMGTLIAFIYPASMYLHVVHEKTTTRLKAKAVVVVGLVCLIGSTYAVLSASNSHEHEVKDVHPPVDPIKAVPSQGDMRADRIQVNAPNLPEVKGGRAKADEDSVSKPPGMIATTPLPTVEAQKAEGASKMSRLETKREETATVKAKEDGTEKEVRKEPPVPNAPNNKKGLKEQAAKPDGRVLMSQPESEEKEKLKENDKKETEKGNVVEVATNVPKNSTETATRVAEGKGSNSDSNLKNLKKRDLDSVTSPEEAPTSSLQNSNMRNENRVDSVGTAPNNDTLKREQENGSMVARKPARDLKSSEEVKEGSDHQDEGEEKESRQMNSNRVIPKKDTERFSRNLRNVLDKRGRKFHSLVLNQKARRR